MAANHPQEEEREHFDDVQGARTVHERIREAMIEGILAPGSRLKVQDLARRFETSSNPIREALQRLQGEGLVLINHNQGAFVRTIDEQFVRNIYELLALIEPYLVRRFVEFALPEEIEKLAELIARFEEHNFGDTQLYRRLDTEIHGLTYQRHYNKQAIDLWKQKRILVGLLGRRYAIGQARRKVILQEHRMLLEAVRQQDVEQAARVVEQHVKGSAVHFIELLRADLPR
ncbi:GntR family transcriptional regulator [Mesorhizobium sp. NPDC059025]|uniref:GntR family transcriptional regulator n=1 Tax=unclassified Mesorhizobium TaxID=325217 RepID=UPI0036AD3B1A